MSIEDQSRITDLDHLARVATRLSKPWATAMAVGAAISTLSFERAANGDVTGRFELSALTAIFAALVWLPAAVRVLALAGGEVRTPAGDATTGGLARVLEPLPSQTKRDTLPDILSALASAEVLVSSAGRDEARRLKRDLELQLAAVTPHAAGIREALDRYAREYENVRTGPSGPARTRRMTSLMAEARAIARAAPPAPVDLRNMLANGDDGDRVVALALAQDHPDPRLSHLVFDAIRESRSAFEQYQALAAAYELLPRLAAEQREALRVVLRSALEDTTRDIREDSSRSILVDAILDDLD